MRTGKIFGLAAAILAACGMTGSVQAAPNWNAVQNVVNEDDSSSILWDRADGAATVWTLAADGKSFTNSAVFGPYPGWRATHLVAIDDNIVAPEILWNRSDGAMAIFNLSTDGQTFTASPTFGPFAGWTARDIGTDDAGSTDLTHVLWTNSNGQMVVWTLAANQTTYTSRAVYGPFSGWSARGIAVEDDGTCAILWNRTDGAIVVWSLAPDGQSYTSSSLFGPFSGWAAKSVTVNCEGSSATGAANSGPIDVLWGRADGAASVFNLSADGTAYTATSIFGPFSGWSAQNVSVQEDGVTQILWTNTNGKMDVYSATDGVTFTLSTAFGPY